MAEEVDLASTDNRLLSDNSCNLFVDKGICMISYNGLYEFRQNDFLS